MTRKKKIKILAVSKNKIELVKPKYAPILKKTERKHLEPPTTKFVTIKEYGRMKKIEVKIPRKPKKVLKKDWEDLYNKAVKKLEKYELEQMARQYATTGGFSSTKKSFIKEQTYEELFREGISRVIEARKVVFKGKEAVKVKLKSIYTASSRHQQKSRFVLQYAKSMNSVGFDDEQIHRVLRAFDRTSTDKLSFLIFSGILPQISYLYDPNVDFEELTQEILDALNDKTFKQDYENYRIRLEKGRRIVNA